MDNLEKFATAVLGGGESSSAEKVSVISPITSPIIHTKNSRGGSIVREPCVATSIAEKDNKHAVKDSSSVHWVQPNPTGEPDSGLLHDLQSFYAFVIDPIMIFRKYHDLPLDSPLNNFLTACRESV